MSKGNIKSPLSGFFVVLLIGVYQSCNKYWPLGMSNLFRERTKFIKPKVLISRACFVSTKAVVSVREHEFCDVIQEFMADNTRMFPKLEVGDSRRKESVDFPVPPIQQRTRTAAS